MDPDYALGFGDLSSFEAGKLAEQGAFIGQGGNNIAGVEQFTSAGGERLIAASDRALRPALHGPARSAASLVLGHERRTARRGQLHGATRLLRRKRERLARRIVSGPSAGTLGPIDHGAGTVTYTSTGSGSATDSFEFAASAGAAGSAAARVTLRARPTLAEGSPFP